MEALMTLFRQSRWISTMIVAVVALAWFVASNHCAIAAFEGMRKASHTCCHEEEPQPAKSTMQCCDTFHVTVPAHVNVPPIQLDALRPAWLETSLISYVIPVRVDPEFHATGPPRALGFAETVLNRSLLSHAPPRFVA